MKKLVMAGAVLILTAFMGMSASAAGTSFFVAKVTPTGAVLRHHAHRTLGSAGRYHCTVSPESAAVSCSEVNGHCRSWSDCDGNDNCTLCGNPVYRESAAVSCSVVNGYCRSWSDCDGNDNCTLCGNPVYRESAAASGNGCHASGHHGGGHHGRGHH